MGFIERFDKHSVKLLLSSILVVLSAILWNVAEGKDKDKQLHSKFNSKSTIEIATNKLDETKKCLRRCD